MHGQKQILHGTKKTDGRRAELLRQIKTSQTLARIKHKHKMDSKNFYIFYIKNLIRFEKRCSFSKDAAFPPQAKAKFQNLNRKKFEEEKKRASFFFLLLLNFVELSVLPKCITIFFSFSLFLLSIKKPTLFSCFIYWEVRSHSSLLFISPILATHGCLHFYFFFLPSFHFRSSPEEQKPQA